MKIFLIAGEASGDLHGAELMKAIRELHPDTAFQFLGGDKMQQHGGEPVKHYRDMAFMGFIPVLKHLPQILKNMSLCREAILDFQPDAVVLIDYPGFNLKIAKYLKQNTSIPVCYYISPKVWAWKKRRIRQFRRYVDQMLCILPFEVDFFAKNNYDVLYVGNPTLNEVEDYLEANRSDSLSAFAADNRLQGDKKIIAILAGSRRQEIADNLPEMLKAVEPCADYQILIAGAPGIEPEFYHPFTRSSDCSVLFGQTYRLLKYANAALVTSGTATLETALFGVPQAVCYKTPLPHISSFIFKHFFGVPCISLVNLVAGKTVVKELFGKDFGVKKIASELKSILEDPRYRETMLANYEEMRTLLGVQRAATQAARSVCGLTEK